LHVEIENSPEQFEGRLVWETAELNLPLYTKMHSFFVIQFKNIHPGPLHLMWKLALIILEKGRRKVREKAVLRIRIRIFFGAESGFGNACPDADPH
jgi:hypothetical protein